MTPTARRVVLLGVSLALLLLFFVWGVAVERHQVFPYDLIGSPTRQADKAGGKGGAGRKGGANRRRRPPKADASAPANDGRGRRRMEELTALGYLGGYETASEEAGATTFDAASVQPGLTLFASGHAPVIYLISLDGKVVHRWQVEFEDLWPGDIPFVDEKATLFGGQKGHVGRAHVFPNGDLIGVFDYYGIFKLDKDSNVLWKRLDQNHHDFTFAADGSIVTLVRRQRSREELAREYPGLEAPKAGIADDHIAILDDEGNIRDTISLLDAFHASDYAPFLDPEVEIQDLFHANSVQILGADDARGPFAEGEILVSVRNLNAVVSVDLDEPRVTWMLTGKWRAQHKAQLLPGGNLMLVDNIGGNSDTPFRIDRSEILEVDPLSQEVIWRYSGSEESPLFTRWRGSVERLENGNTLITESIQGRILEVTPDGRLVWKFVTPHRTGKDGELIANVIGAQRIDPAELDFLRP